MKINGETKIIFGSLLFAFIPVCVKFDTSNSIYSLLFGRLIFASLVLFLLKRSSNYFLKITARDFGLLFIWSSIMFGAMVFYFQAINIAGVAISSALLGSQPLLILLLALLFLKEKLNTKTIASCVITLIGIFFLLNFTELSFSTIKSGHLLAIGSALLLSLNFVFQKKYLSRFSSDKLVFYQSFFQLPLLIPFLLHSPPQLSYNFFIASVLLGVFCTVAAYRLIYSGAATVNAQKIGVLQSIEYVMPMLFGVLFYHENLRVVDFIGAILIIASTLLISFKLRLKPNHSY